MKKNDGGRSNLEITKYKKYPYKVQLNRTLQVKHQCQKRQGLYRIRNAGRFDYRCGVGENDGILVVS